MGTLRTEREPTQCGRHCTTTTTLTVQDKDGSPLLSVSNDDYDGPHSDGDGFDPLVSVRCERGAVLVALEDGDDAPLRLAWDEKTRQLRLAHSALVQRALATTPLSGAKAEQRAHLHALARVLLGSTPLVDPNSGARVELTDIDTTFVDRLALGTARDALEAGFWEQAQNIIEHVTDSWPPVNAAAAAAMAAQPPLALRKQAAALQAELADRRKNSEPLHVLGRIHLGTTRKVQALPIDAGLAPTLFWRRGEVCVVQEDTSGTMRCYAPSAQRWSPKVPIELPKSSGLGLKQLNFSSFSLESCLSGSTLSRVVRKEIPDTSVSPCEQGPGSDLEDVLAVVDGNVLLRAGFELDRGGSRGEPLFAAQANAVFARSAGGLLTGDGRARFLRDGRLARATDDGEHRWHVLGAAAQGETWGAPPLVSPDQRWVVAQSQRADGVTLWLFQLSPPTTPAP